MLLGGEHPARWGRPAPTLAWPGPWRPPTQAADGREGGPVPFSVLVPTWILPRPWESRAPRHVLGAADGPTPAALTSRANLA